MSFARGLKTIVVANGLSGRPEAAFRMSQEMALSGANTDACAYAEIR